MNKNKSRKDNTMTYKQSAKNRITSIVLTLAMLLSIIPFTVFSVSAASVDAGLVADISTMDSWKDFFFTSGNISTENAGAVWTDKSVFTDAAAFADLGITKNDQNSFLVALSAIAANMSITGTSGVPTDTMLILDVSGSMNDNYGNNDVAEDLVNAANESIATLLSANKTSRVGVVLYSGSSDSSTNYTTASQLLLPMARYSTASDGKYLTYTVKGWSSTTETIGIDGDVTFEASDDKPAPVSKDVVGATYIQRGIITAMEEFLGSGNEIVQSEHRKPVIVLMSDGAPSLGSTDFTDPGKDQNGGYDLGTGSGTSAALGFVSQLTASYAKAKIEEKYGTDALFYTLGLGIDAYDSVALSVMDPENRNGSTAVDDFWNDIQTNRFGRVTFEGYNHIDAGETVSLGNNRYVTKIETPLEQNYVDRYFAASTGNLVQVFKSIMSAIKLQSAYFPTLVSQSEDLSGYVSFVDRIGEYMEVTDIKGIVINDQLFSGADLASNFVTGGGQLGTWGDPSPLGLEMVSAVRARLGLDSDDTSRTLIELAYRSGQLSYTDESTYSNYIGWYANAKGEYLGFYDENTTILPSATGNEKTDPAFVIRSYGYLGAVDESHGVSESDMMYATVQIRTNIASGEQLVTFAVPAALIPVITYEVTLDDQGELTALALLGADDPIRLVYEVALDEGINSFNIKEVLSDEYLSDPHNVNPDGSVNFYTNQWEHQNTTGYGTVNTYSYFNPSRQNDKYYYLEDTALYINANGELYYGADQPDESSTFYRSYKVYKNDSGNLKTETVYRPVSDATKKTSVRRSDNSWYVPKGDVHTNLDGYTVDKEENRTKTLSRVQIPFVDTKNHAINEEGYHFYVGATLGNNGKLTVNQKTVIKLSKTLASDAASTNEAFTFNIFNISNESDSGTYPALLVNYDGTYSDINVTFDNGISAVDLRANEAVYIAGIKAGDTFRIEEKETAEYIAQAVGLSKDGTVTALENEIQSVSFTNRNRGKGSLTVAKEVAHDFGQNYQIPEDKIFTMQVSLSGIGTENAEFAVAHSGDGELKSLTTDENGIFTFTLKHNEKLEIYDLFAGTDVSVTEIESGEGFTALYWCNGVLGNGYVTISDSSVSEVIVVNDYAPAEVYPVNITVSGIKTLNGRENNEWLSTDSFTFELQRYDGVEAESGNAIWTTLKEATATPEDHTFDFTDAFANERYTNVGTYYYRVVETEPETHTGGIAYDKTVHSFSVIVSDVDMDGKLEIANVLTARPETTKISVSENGWAVHTSFTNTYSTSGNATVTIDLNKTVTSNSGIEMSPAGFSFGLYDGNELVIKSDVTTDRGFARLVLSYTETGTYSYVLKEIAPDTSLNGWTYSTLEIPVTVKVSDNGDGTVSAVIFSGNEQPSNAGSSISATFNNIYDPVDAELSIDFVRKQLIGRPFAENDEFTFTLTEINAPVGTVNRALTGKADKDTDIDGIASVRFNDTLRFDKVGTYAFEIKENGSDENGIVNDKNAYHVIVTVSDEGGKLNASYVIVNTADDTVTFKNTYTAAAIDHSIKGTKELIGRTLVNDEFSFILTELSYNSEPIAEPQSWTVKNFASAKDNIVFPSITYTRAGTYIYTVNEVIPTSETLHGISYDDRIYTVTVVIEDDGMGTLTVGSEKVSSDSNELKFENIYKADPASVQFTAEKQLTGRVDNALSGGEYEFELYRATSDWEKLGAPIETVKNEKGGLITFNKIDFDSTGDQYFIVVEKAPANAVDRVLDGVTYDDTEYHVWVQITDDLKGQLHTSIHIYNEENIPQDKITFINVYSVTKPDFIELSGTKTLQGRDWNENDRFEFELYAASSEFETLGSSPIASAAADTSSGRFSIELSYTPEDIGSTFFYVLKEMNAGDTANGITYSSTEYMITVNVTDGGSGNVNAEASVEGSAINTLDFTNSYNAEPAEALIGGSKKLYGRELENGEFRFIMAEADEHFNALEGSLPMTALNGEDGSFTFDPLTFTEEGSYFFIVYEDDTVNAERVIFDGTVYNVRIDVTDDENGNLTASRPQITVKDSSEGSDFITFSNIYTPKPDDITVDINIVKTVVNKGTETMSPEGFEFLLEDLENAENGLTVSSDADGKAKFTLSFTEEDIGRSFSYKLTEINGGVENVTYSTEEYTITVSVALDDESNTLKANVTVNNKATKEPVASFENIYDYTIPTTPDNPPTGEKYGIGMWVMLMIVSGGAAITLCIGKKRRIPADI